MTLAEHKAAFVLGTARETKVGQFAAGRKLRLFQIAAC
jgi:hypothetical protein